MTSRSRCRSKPLIAVVFAIVLLSSCGDPDDGQLDGDVTDADQADSDQPDTADSDTGRPDGDVEEEVPPPASAVIGPEGGAVSLEDGTTLTIPPDAVEEDTEFGIIPVERIPTLDDDAGIIPFGTAFRIEPMGRGLELFTLTIPAALLPEGFTSEDIDMHRVNEGDPDLDIRAPIIGPEETDDEGAHFELMFIGPSTFQPFVVTNTGPPPPETGFHGGFPAFLSKVPYPTPVDRSCSKLFDDELGAAFLTGLGITAAQLDARADIKMAPNFHKKLRDTWNTMDAKLPAAAAEASIEMLTLMEAVNVFQMRSCIAAYRSLDYYENQMGFPVPSKRLDITVSWRYCKNASLPDSHADCSGTFGVMSDGGVTMFFRAGNVAAGSIYPGYLPVGDDNGPWNAPPPAGVDIGSLLKTHFDGVDGTMAHEVFHWLEERSNNVVGESAPALEGTWVFGLGVLDASTHFTNFFVEGSANHAAEQVYDDRTHWCRSRPMLWTCGLHKNGCRAERDNMYAGWSLWRFLDWTQDSPTRDGSFAARALRLVKSRSPAPILAKKASPTRLNRADIDGIVQSMYPSRKNYDFDDALTDFAAAMVFTHDFEHGTTPAEYDRYPDVMGKVLEETTLYSIWDKTLQCRLPAAEGGGWHKYVSDLDTIDDYRHENVYTVSPENGSELDGLKRVNDLGAYTARGFKLHLDGAYFDPEGFRDYEGVQVQIHSDDSEQIGARFYYKKQAAPPDRAELFWSRDKISTKAGAPTYVVLPRDWITLYDFYLVLLNHDTEDTLVTLEFDRAPSIGLVVAADGSLPGRALAAFDPFTLFPVEVCTEGAEGLDLSSSMHPDAMDVGNRTLAVAYPYSGEIQFYDRADCSLKSTVTFPEGEPGPMAFDTMEDPRYLVVARADPRNPCAPGAISVVEIETGDVVGTIATPMGASSVVVVNGASGPEAIATMRGNDDTCINNELYIAIVSPPFSPESSELAGISFTTLGSFSGRHGPIARNVERTWAAWVTEYEDINPETTGDGGRIGLLRASDHHYRLLGAEDHHPGTILSTDFDLPRDVAVTTDATGVRAYFVTSHSVSGDSGLRWISWDGGETVTFPDVLTISGSARHVGISPDDRSVFVTRAEGDDVLVYDIGDGGFERFRVDPATPTIPGVFRPITLHMH